MRRRRTKKDGILFPRDFLPVPQTCVHPPAVIPAGRGSRWNTLTGQSYFTEGKQSCLPKESLFLFFFIKITICQAACFLLYKIGLMGLCTGFSFLSGFEVFYHCFFGCVDAGSASKKGGRGGDKVGDFPQKNKGKNPSSNQNFTGSP